MAQYTRTYTYTKGDKEWSTTACNLALSDFVVSGETEKPISKIISVTARYACNQTVASSVIFKFRLTIGETDYAGESSTFSKDSSRWLKQALVEIPAASVWVQSNIRFKANVNYKDGSSARSKVSWEGSTDHPITITLVYESESLKPTITGIKMNRCDVSGNAKDSGEYVSFSATLAAEKLGGTGAFNIYDGSGTAVYTQTGITLAEAQTITGYGIQQDTGTTCTYTLEFAYTKTIDDTVLSETVTATAVVTKVVTNVHLSGCSTGGVRFGSYSRSTEGKALFECDYPTYAYGGIVNIASGTTAQAVHANGTEETVEFGVTYQSPPVVVAGINCDADGSSFGGCFVAVKSVTTTGFTLRYANTSGSTRTFAVNWLAYGLISEVT